ncbi:MAG: AAA family ATPase [Dehalococcoidia bacterium]
MAEPVQSPELRDVVPTTVPDWGLGLLGVEFVAGSRPGAAPARVGRSSIILIVGPNGSGKSVALRELQQRWSTIGHEPSRVVNRVNVTIPGTWEALCDLLGLGRNVDVGGTWRYPQSTRRGNAPTYHQEPILQLKQYWDNGSYDSVREIIGGKFVYLLDARSRFELLQPSERLALTADPATPIHALHKSKPLQRTCRRWCYEAFGKYLVIDEREATLLRLAMSSKDPDQSVFGTGPDLEYLSETTDLSSEGDGVQAFIAILTAVAAFSERLILVDEPDSFLHPSASRVLGRALVDVVKGRNASVVVATHSADFVYGCIESGEPVSVVRLGWDGTVATASAIDPDTLSDLSRDPYLRTTEPLRALFHRAAVVTEGEDDRAFYDQMNHLLRQAGRGLDDTLFVRTIGKDRIHGLVAKLRRLGVPTAAVVDSDWLSGSVSLARVHELGVPTEVWERVRQERDSILDTVRRRSSDAKNVGSWDGSELARWDELRRVLSTYGVFVVARGALESWLGGRLANSKPNVFEKAVGLTASGEVVPGDGDVWSFLDEIEAWVANPNRLGMMVPTADQTSEIAPKPQAG